MLKDDPRPFHHVRRNRQRQRQRQRSAQPAPEESVLERRLSLQRERMNSSARG